MTVKTISKNCSVEGCQRSGRITKGLCNAHYLALTRRGSLELKHREMCSVSECRQKHYSKSYCIKHYRRVKKYGNPFEVKLNVGKGTTFEERFWSKVDKTANPKGCWEWTGIQSKCGYGQTQHKGKRVSSHRRAWIYIFGFSPALFLLHSCDNKLCVNPVHLREGTHQDNMDDKIVRGRQSKGECHGKSKLNESDVRTIKERLNNGEQGRTLAIEYQLSDYAISAIKTGKTWRHILW